MTQPLHLPRAATTDGPAQLRLEHRPAWSPSRPGALAPATPLTGNAVGKPGPNQGFALTLAHRLHGELVLEAGEDAHDVEVGAAALACARAAHFGRAPQIFDVRVALAVFGFFGPADAALVAERRRRFAGVSHAYPAQRALVDSVPASTLALPVADALALDWTEAIGA